MGWTMPRICTSASRYLLQLADLAAIFRKADDGEAALVVGGLRRADVEETRAVYKLNHIINMRGNTDVFIEHLRGLVGGYARLDFGGRGERGTAEREHHEQARERGRIPSLLGVSETE